MVINRIFYNSFVLTLYKSTTLGGITMANVNGQTHDSDVKRVKVWSSEEGYIAEKTPELEAEVRKIVKLWNESDALEGYCPHEREAKVHEYRTPGYEIGTVAEHYGVVSIVLYKLENK